MILPRLVVASLVAPTVLACQSPRPETIDPLSHEEVEKVSRFEGFERTVDRGEPTAENGGLEGPCRALFDQVAAFGEDWTAFRFVTDEGDVDAGGVLPTMASVAQTVVAYANDAAAHEVFDRRTAAMAECAKLDLPFTGGVLERPGSATVVYSNEQWTLVSVVKSAVIADVSVVGRPDTERVAIEISRQLVAN